MPTLEAEGEGRRRKLVSGETILNVWCCVALVCLNKEEVYKGIEALMVTQQR